MNRFYSGKAVVSIAVSVCLLSGCTLMPSVQSSTHPAGTEDTVALNGVRLGKAKLEQLRRRHTEKLNILARNDDQINLRFAARCARQPNGKFRTRGSDGYYSETVVKNGQMSQYFNLIDPKGRIVGHKPIAKGGIVHGEGWLKHPDGSITRYSYRNNKTVSWQYYLGNGELFSLGRPYD